MILRTGILLFIAVALLSLGCGHDSHDDFAGSQFKNVFGVDNREDITSLDYPWSAIGRLDNGCSGTLVGRKLVLTAAHCAFDSTKKLIKSDLAYFRPNYRGKASSDDTATWIDYVWYGTDKPEDNRTQDWAILRLSKPIGETYKWMSVRKIDFAAHLPYTTNLAGYSSDRNGGGSPAVHRGCYIHEIKEDRLLNDCDATSGISGGPLFNVFDGVATIVAIAVSEYRQGASDSIKVDSFDAEHANVAISAEAFADKIDTLRKTIDVDINSPAISGVFEAANPNVPGSPALDPNLPNPQKPENPPQQPNSHIEKVITRMSDVEKDAQVILQNAVNIQRWTYEAVHDPTLIAYATNLVTSAQDLQKMAADINAGKFAGNGREIAVSQLEKDHGEATHRYLLVNNYCEGASHILYDPEIDRLLREVRGKLEEVRVLIFE